MVIDSGHWPSQISVEYQLKVGVAKDGHYLVHDGLKQAINLIVTTSLVEATLKYLASSSNIVNRLFTFSELASMFITLFKRAIVSSSKRHIVDSTRQ